MTQRNKEIDDWCDATRSLLEAPEGSRIEGHAVELISRVLNARPVVAFVGAGTSMAYGRLSWRDAVIHMQTSSLEAARQQEPRLSVNARRAWELLERQQIDPNRATNPNNYLVSFQLAEQLTMALPRGEDQTNAFRNEVKDLLKDDYGHAKLILERAPSPPDRTRSLERTDSPGKRDIRHRDYLMAVLAAVDGTGIPEDLLNALRAFRPDDDPRDCSRGYLRPYHRFAIEAARHLLTDTKMAPPVWNDKNTPARRALLPIDRDPLRLAVRPQDHSLSYNEL